jgi:hypothetical protein
MGAHAYIVAGGFALLGGVLVVISIRMVGPKATAVEAAAP